MSTKCMWQEGEEKSALFACSVNHWNITAFMLSLVH